MRPIRILVIAPYDGMAEIYMQLDAQRTNVSLSVFTGNLETGLAVAREQLQQQHFDAIISRGGTAELLRRELPIPVIDTEISVYDVLRAIKLAENYSGSFAVAGFSSITNCARIICNLLRYNVDIFTFTDSSEVVPALESLRARGYNLIICDMIGTIVSSQLGLSSILVASGKESCENALDTAMQMISESRSLYQRNLVFQAILQNSDEQYLIYDSAGKEWFSTLGDSAVDLAIKDMAVNYASSSQKNANRRVTKKLGDQMVTISGKEISCDGETYTVINISLTPSLAPEEDESILVYNQTQEDSRTYLSKYNSANYVGDTRRMIESYARTLQPVLILGETGTGKDKAAELIYSDSVYSTFPLFVIDCDQMSERKWASLMTNDSSPLNELKTTLYFKHVNALSATKIDRLISYCNASDLSRRNRLIFSFVEDNATDLRQNPVYSWLTNRLQCMVLRLQPLRERTEDLPSISTLYFNQLNAELGKQIVGFSPQALRLMQEFPWPHNLDQLHRVIHELAILEKGAYIEEEQVRMILKVESNALTPDQCHLPAASLATSLDLNRSLEEINYDIIRIVLKEEHMSREKTAARLGISRSTLWRILKTNEQDKS